MDFTKFLKILQNKSLWFSRIDLLGDPLEAKFTKYDLQQEALNLQVNQVGIPKSSTMKFWEKYMPRLHFANCWHRNEYESAAMWKVYTSNNKEAIAIQSTFGKLKDCFTGDAPIYAGNVKYIDSSSQPLPMKDMVDIVTHKRLSFSHENEVRALRQLIPPNFESNYLDELSIPPGNEEQINVETLIEKIHLPPQSHEWFKTSVKSIITKYNFSFDVDDSEMDERGNLT